MAERIERPQEREGLVFDVCRRRRHRRIVHKNDIKNRAEGQSDSIQVVGLKIAPMSRAQTKAQGSERGKRLGRTEFAMPGAMDEQFTQ